MPCPCQGNNNAPAIQAPTIPSLPKPDLRFQGGRKIGNWNPQSTNIVENKQEGPSDKVFVFQDPVEQKQIETSQGSSVIVTVVNSDDPQLKEFAQQNSISIDQPIVSSPSSNQEVKVVEQTDQQQQNLLPISNVENKPKTKISSRTQSLFSVERSVPSPSGFQHQGNKISTRSISSAPTEFSIQDIPIASVNPKAFRQSTKKISISTKNDKEVDLFFGKDPY